jgi:DNA-binding NtrC family response regulator
MAKDGAATWTPKPVRPPETEPDILLMVQGISAENLVGEGVFQQSVAKPLPQAPAGQAVLPPDGLSLKEHLLDIERDYIQQALERSQGNVSRAARLLSLQRTTLIEKINKLGLKDPAEIDQVL